MKILPNGLAVIDDEDRASCEVAKFGLLYEPMIREKLMPLLRPGDTAIDAGAMLGGYSHGMKLAVGKTGRVIAFEPNPMAHECLAHNCPDVECVMLGLGRSSATSGMVVNPHNQGSNWITGSGSQQVAIVPLDYFTNYWTPKIDRIRLIKIDVEGMEFDVIAGATLTISKMRPIVYCEVNHLALERQGHTFIDVLSPLFAMGYRLEWVQPGVNLNRDSWPHVDLIFHP